MVKRKHGEMMAGISFRVPLCPCLEAIPWKEHIMKCWNCGFENPPNAKFCNNCGQAEERACPNCGTKNTAGAKFCSNCGTNLQDGRRQAPCAPTPAKAIPRAAETPQALIEKYMPKEIASKLEAAGVPAAAWKASGVSSRSSFAMSKARPPWQRRWTPKNGRI